MQAAWQAGLFVTWGLRFGVIASLIADFHTGGRAVREEGGSRTDPQPLQPAVPAPLRALSVLGAPVCPAAALRGQRAPPHLFLAALRPRIDVPAYGQVVAGLAPACWIPKWSWDLQDWQDGSL